MPHEFILIPGRTSKQGTSLNISKSSDEYLQEISTLRMHPDDMQSLSLQNGDSVRLWNDIGEIVVQCTSGKDELPQGVLFISYGNHSCKLMGAETHGSGMPDSKGLDVLVEKFDPTDDTPLSIELE